MSRMPIITWYVAYFLVYLFILLDNYAKSFYKLESSRKFYYYVIYE